MSENKIADLLSTLATLINGDAPENPIKEDQPKVTDSDILMKAFDEEERLVLGVVLEPDTFDLHKDIYDAVEVRKAQENFNKNCMQANLGHVANVDDIQITKSFILEVDAHIGEQPVKAGSWLMEMHVPSDAAWQEVKEGGFTGFSIGASARVEDI